MIAMDIGLLTLTLYIGLLTRTLYIRSEFDFVLAPTLLRKDT